MGEVDAAGAIALLEPGDILVDCTGSRSVMRDLLVPGDIDPTVHGRNTTLFRLEYALVVTFLYDQHYACDEFCKYYKNVENPTYKFIPAVHRTLYDGATSHVTGIVAISKDEFDAMPPTFDGAWLRDNFPGVAESMDRFIDKVKAETHGELVGDIEIMRIPLDVYHAWNMTSRPCTARRQPPARDGAGLPPRATPRSGHRTSGRSRWASNRLLPGGPSSEPGAAHRGRLRALRGVHVPPVAAGLHADPMIKHNKDLLQSVGDTFGLLAKLHVY